MPKSKRDYKKQADALFGKLIRSRGVCESDRLTHSGNLQCAHIISRSYAGIRTDETNALCLCQGCHIFYTHRPIEWRDFIESSFPGRWDALREKALRYDRVDWRGEVQRLAS